MTQPPIYLAVALDGAGWHPSAWREPDARSAEIFGGAYWRDLARTAENGGIDLLTIEDALGLQTPALGDIDPTVTNEVRGRLDAVLLASWLAPLTNRIGLVPTVTTTHTEPFHVSTAIATLDYASNGRAGLRAQVSGRSHEAAHFGRRSIPRLHPGRLDSAEGVAALNELFDEAADALEVVRRLWDSWQDDAVIRDQATGRFIDRDRLHYIDFTGEQFTVRGPSITPRPPQGQPLVTALAHQTIPYRLAGRQADIVYITPHDDAQVLSIAAEVRAAERFVGRRGTPLGVWADILVVLDDTPDAARRRLERLDDQHGTPLTSDALIFTGTPGGLVEQLLHWSALGIDGFRLRPAALPHDLQQIADRVVPLLTSSAALDRDRDATTLRSFLGFEPAPNRYTDEPLFGAAGERIAS